ncbi:MAG: T9SS type A sorting domain-containing protein [Lewinella sp.]|nr:T9SS type A sorting domain-containing protein [Lewinella sp.]
MKIQLHPTAFATLFLALLLSLPLAGQTARNIVVEHFTNTKCPICGNRNPGFYANLATQGDNVLHIAYHPQYPYASCIFHQHNPAENNFRFNLYGVQGTPTLVMQGQDLIGGSSMSSATLFDPYENQTSPAMIDILQTKFGQDSIRATVTVTVTEAHDYGEVNLLVYAVEKLIEYNAPNGETEHHDVFRHSFDGIQGYSFTLPATIGESVTYTRTLAADAAWDFDQMYTFVMLQDPSDNFIIQGAVAAPDQNDTPLATAEPLPANSLRVYPNPTTDQVWLEFPTELAAAARLSDARGTHLRTWNFQGKTQIDLSQLPAGVYQIQVETEAGTVVKQVVKW